MHNGGMTGLDVWPSCCHYKVPGSGISSRHCPLCVDWPLPQRAGQGAPMVSRSNARGKEGGCTIKNSLFIIESVELTATLLHRGGSTIKTPVIQLSTQQTASQQLQWRGSQTMPSWYAVCTECGCHQNICQNTIILYSFI